MKVVLIRDVKGLGKKFEEKNVSEGYAVNFLIPRKLAVPALGTAASQIKNLKENEERHKEAERDKLEVEIHKLANATIEIKMKTNEKNHLFVSLTSNKIMDILKQEGIEIPVEFINLERPIKEAGKHTILVTLGDKVTHFTLSIEPTK